MIIDHREVIFDGYGITEGITDRLQEDIYAMYHILALGQRSGLNVVILDKPISLTTHRQHNFLL